jgi:hypothetical protein
VSRLRPLASVLLGAFLWLSSTTGGTTAHVGEAGISTASAATLALPSVPVRLGRTSSASAGSPLARDIAQSLIPLASHAAAPLACIRRTTTPRAGNGRASRDVLALTFPYDATAPPELRV